MTELLFSFGTLRQADVQEALFGRRVLSTPDQIVGYKVRRVQIVDPAAIEASGSDLHPALVVTGEPDDVVRGEVLELTEADLAAAHRYEQVSFERIDVHTQSGRRAVAYVPKPGLRLVDDGVGTAGSAGGTDG